jgi:hypothetical protein
MTTLNTIEMTRRIRDALYERTKDMSLEERIAFYRDAARVVHQQLGLSVSSSPHNDQDVSQPAQAHHE